MKQILIVVVALATAAAAPFDPDRVAEAKRKLEEKQRAATQPATRPVAATQPARRIFIKPGAPESVRKLIAASEALKNEYIQTLPAKITEAEDHVAHPRHTTKPSSFGLDLPIFEDVKAWKATLYQCKKDLRDAQDPAAVIIPPAPAETETSAYNVGYIGRIGGFYVKEIIGKDEANVSIFGQLLVHLQGLQTTGWANGVWRDPAGIAYEIPDEVTVGKSKILHVRLIDYEKWIERR